MRRLKICSTQSMVASDQKKRMALIAYVLTNKSDQTQRKRTQLNNFRNITTAKNRSTNGMETLLMALCRLAGWRWLGQWVFPLQ